MLADGSTHGAVMYFDGTDTLLACCEWSDIRSEDLSDGLISLDSESSVSDGLPNGPKPGKGPKGPKK